jgi:ribonuclease HII
VVTTSADERSQIDRNLRERDAANMNLPDGSVLDAGLDEAGRGCLYGSVFAGVCIMPPLDSGYDLSLVKDSKRFSSRPARAAAAAYVRDTAIDWAVGHATAREIDVANVQEATYIAMHRAVAKLTVRPDLLSVDGDKFKPYIVMMDDGEYDSIRHRTIVKGDATHACIAAASILAKTAHDEYIASMCMTDPSLELRYGLLRNMGYGTATHMDGLAAHGTADGHRRSFRLPTNSLKTASDKQQSEDETAGA